MIIHFLPDSVYSKSCISYIHSNYQKQEHIFYVISRNELTYLKDVADVYIINNPSNWIVLRQIWKATRSKSCTRIFVHFLSDIHLFPILFSRRKQKKYWLFWGADLYSHIDYPIYDNKTKSIINHDNKLSYQSRIFNILRRFTIRKVNYIAINEVEYKILKNYYQTDAKRIDFKYPNPITCKTMPDISFKQTVRNNQKIILLGNSGDPSNNHLDILEKLAKITCDFKVIIPLSYSTDEDYVQYVLKKGQELLGDKFQPLIEFLRSDEYSKLLSTIDIAIMNHYRQQAAGNLRVLLSLGKKIYVNKTSPLYEYYSQNGIFLNTLQECVFDNSIFLPYPLEIQIKNKEAIEKIYSNEMIDQYMNAIFD